MKWPILWLVLVVTTTTAAQDEVWADRGNANGSQKAYEFYRTQFIAKRDYDSAWQFARAASYYADNFLTDQNQKKAIFNEGKVAAEAAAKMDPRRPEAWYFLGVCWGQWAETNGIMDSLFAAGGMLDAASRAINADPTYLHGAPYVLRGRIYHKAPGIISVGDEKKAEADYKRAMDLGPKDKTVRRFYAEFLQEHGHKAEALALVNLALALPANDEDPFVDQKEVRELKKLQAQLH